LQFNNAVITLDYKKYINPTFLHIVKWPYSGFGIIRGWYFLIFEDTISGVKD
jgi:hypothetical protein